MSEQNKIDHDQSGNVRATHIEGEGHGITNRPSEEADRQGKVVDHAGNKEQAGSTSKA